MCQCGLYLKNNDFFIATLYLLKSFKGFPFNIIYIYMNLIIQASTIYQLCIKIHWVGNFLRKLLLDFECFELFMDILCYCIMLLNASFNCHSMKVGQNKPQSVRHSEMYFFIPSHSSIIFIVGENSHKSSGKALSTWKFLLVKKWYVILSYPFTK